jgi:hypothetical protein
MIVRATCNRQNIKQKFLTTTHTHTYRPCSGKCPERTYISAVCNGKGRTDTGCTICRSFCTEAQPGVADAHGQYITALCDGTGTTDVQTCANCRLCPADHYPTSLCDGRSFTDTVECKPCLTSCPPGYYLKGNCKVEEVKCVPCDMPCTNQSMFLQETRACANGENRICTPTTKCKVSRACSGM